MRNIYLGKAIFFMVLFFLVASQGYAIDHSNLRIKVDRTERTLIAPESSNYTWYRNGIKMAVGQQVIDLEKTGVYSVTFTDEEGYEVTRSVQVSINDQGQIYVIHIIGDSTVANYSSGNYPMTGWGQVLSHFFNSANVVINNRAIGGRSAKSYYRDHWSGVIDGVQAGDYVFVQFGINDAASDTGRYSAPWEGFQDYLTLFVNETQAKGATCVLVATLRRNAWNNTSPPTLYDAYHDYPVATRALAAELNVPLIDLDQATVPLLESVGPAYTGPFMYMNLVAGDYPNYPNGLGDNVHFQEMGAIEMAKLVVQEIQSQAAVFPVMNLLAPALKPQYQVTVNQSIQGAGLVTRTQSFPAGVKVTLKAIPNDGYLFQGWQNSGGAIVSTDLRYSFTMGSSATNYTAVFAWNNDCTAITPYIQINGGPWNQVSEVSVSSGDHVVLGPQPTSGGTWNWSGPGGFSATTREIDLSDIQTTQAGKYIATFSSNAGCLTTHTFQVTVDGLTEARGVITLSATATNAAINLSWTLSNISSTLQIFRDTDSDPYGRVRIAIVGNGTRSYTDTDVVSGTAYYYWIKAVDINGTTINSQAASATVNGSETPVITIQENASGFCGVDGTVDSDHGGYSGPGFINTSNAEGTGADWSISGGNGSYTFRWKYANGGPSNRTGVLYVNENSLATVDFNSTGGWDAWAVAEVTVSNVASGSKSIRLQANQSAGLSNIDYLEVSGPDVAAANCNNGRSITVTSGHPTLEGLKPFPNPVTTDLTISLGEEKSVTAWVYDVSGRMVLNKELTTQDHKINVSDLAKGVYYLEMNTSAGHHCFRFLKQ